MQSEKAAGSPPVVLPCGEGLGEHRERTLPPAARMTLWGPKPLDPGRPGCSLHGRGGQSVEVQPPGAQQRPAVRQPQRRTSLWEAPGYWPRSRLPAESGTGDGSGSNPVAATSPVLRCLSSLKAPGPHLYAVFTALSEGETETQGPPPNQELLQAQHLKGRAYPSPRPGRDVSPQQQVPRPPGQLGRPGAP